MKVQWIQNDTLRIKTLECVMSVNPRASKDIKEDDLVIYTHSTEEGVYGGSSFVISTPGEYSYKGVSVLAQYVQYEQRQLIISYAVESMKTIILTGDYQELSSSLLEFIGTPDILILALQETIQIDKVIQHIASIEPRIVIPVGEERLIHNFAESYGLSLDTKKSDEIIIKKSDLPFDSTEVRLLNEKVK